MDTRRTQWGPGAIRNPLVRRPGPRVRLARPEDKLRPGPTPATVLGSGKWIPAFAGMTDNTLPPEIGALFLDGADQGLPFRQPIGLAVAHRFHPVGGGVDDMILDQDRLGVHLPRQ